MSKNGFTNSDTCEVIKCPKCSRKLRVPMDKGRISVRCSSCGYVFIEEGYIYIDDEEDLYSVVSCPYCYKKLRVPNNKGKISITCKFCGKKFIKDFSSLSKKAVGWIDKIINNTSETAINLRSFYRSFCRTVDEEGAYRTLMGKAEDKHRENFLSEDANYNYTKWLELREDLSFSPSIVRYIWYLYQTNPLEAYEDELLLMIACESPELTRKSIHRLKTSYSKLYGIDKEGFDIFCELQHEIQENFYESFKSTDIGNLESFISSKILNEQNNKIIKSDKKIYAKCPRCKSLNFYVKKNGVSISQAVGGAVLLGPLGLLHGLTGKDKIVFVCKECNKEWYPPPPDYGDWPEYITRSDSQYGM